jgi:hypothetical protein
MGGSLILFQPPVLGSSGFIKKLQNKISSGFGVLKISKQPAKFPQ